jgi:hypothetical protein
LIFPFHFSNEEVCILSDEITIAVILSGGESIPEISIISKKS